MRSIVTIWGAFALVGGLSGVGCGPVADPARPASPSSRPRAARDRPALASEGEPCPKTTACKAGLTCIAQWCRHPSCGWALGCLRKLKVKYKGTPRGYEVRRWYAKLSKASDKAECLDMPKRIAFLLYSAPHIWKNLCGAPPVSGVRKLTDKSNPFKLNDHQIKASSIPSEEKAEIRKIHKNHPDLCKAWVDFKLTRPFQGWVIARVHEQYGCDAKRYRARLKDPHLKPKCKTRLYARSDRRYLFLQKKGTRLSLNFYFSTPPQVCKKLNLSNKYYKTGCFCLGLDTAKVKLEWKEDPFLYLDEKKP